MSISFVMRVYQIKRFELFQTCDQGIKLQVLTDKFREPFAKSFEQEEEDHRDERGGQPKYEDCKHVPLLEPVPIGSFNESNRNPFSASNVR